MKEILVAVDFSKGSVHALEYAVNIANKVGANIHLVWVDNQKSPESVYPDLTNEYRNGIIKNFEKLIKEYQAQLKTTISYKMRKGKVYHEIAFQASNDNIDLIIIGTHGVSGFEEYWIGSNAYRIVVNAPCPVLTVRNEHPFKNEIKKIILPIDNTAHTLEKIPFVVNLAKHYNSEIYLLGLYSTSLKSLQKKVDDQVMAGEKMLKEGGVKYKVETTLTDNGAKAAIDFADKVDADLITIMTEQETTMDNVLLGAYAQQLINYAARPVLSIKPKEIPRMPIS